MGWSRPSRFPWRLAFALAVAALVPAAALRPAQAAPAEEDWERAVREAEADQDAQLLKSSPNAMVSRLSSLAARTPSALNLYLLARAFGFAKQVADSITTYGEVLKAQPTFYFAYYGRAFGLREQKKLVDAETDLKKAVDTKRDFLKGLRLLAQVEVELGKMEEALAVLWRIVALDPHDDPARVLIAQVYLKLGRGDDAMNALKVLLAKDDKNPALRHMLGQAQALRKDWVAALAIFKRLGEENPNRPEPFAWYLDVAGRASKAEGKELITREEALWALRALLRLETNEEKRRQILEEIARREKPAEGTGPQGPPTPEDEIKLLGHQDPKAREAILRWLLAGSSKEPLTTEVLKALIPRLEPNKEPDPILRRLALAVFAKYGQPSLAAIVRTSLRDPDAQVRATAADALLSLGSPAAILALQKYAAMVSQDVPGTLPDFSFPVAARHSLYALAGVTVPTKEDALPEEQAKAFEAWWKSPDARDAKRKAIAGVIESRDQFPDDLLLPLCFFDRDSQVWPDAYRALHTMAIGSKKQPPEYDAWLRSIPEFADDVLVEPNREGTFLQAMVPWWDKRPASLR